MIRRQYTACALVVALVMISAGTHLKADGSAPGAEHDLPALASSHSNVEPLSVCAGQTPRHAVLLRAAVASNARTAGAGEQLQPTKLHDDRKTKLIIVGIVAAAATIWIVYQLRHLNIGVTSR